jgi:hypothetical protein
MQGLTERQPNKKAGQGELGGGSGDAKISGDGGQTGQVHVNRHRREGDQPAENQQPGERRSGQVERLGSMG